jgi:carbonic anhydrase
MAEPRELLESNRAWSARRRQEDPEFFARLARQEAPEYLWIGCSDSRVPANEIVGRDPGEMFVHRNVANVVVHSDLNCLSVLQFAIDLLGVRHVIVCGHYGCGGVQAAWRTTSLGLIDSWLRHVQDVADPHREALEALRDEPRILDRLCELNVLAQVEHVARTPIVQEAWRRGRELSVRGWIYGVGDGLLVDLGLCLRGEDDPRKERQRISHEILARASS